MAKFTAEEVCALEGGGNERARQIYFKEWDPLRNGYPDNNNLYRLRDFIKHVYVDRRYSGDGGSKLPRQRYSESEFSYGSRKLPPFSPGSSNQHLSERNERSNHEAGGATEAAVGRSSQFYDSRSRSPRPTQQSSRVGGTRRNPVKIEVVDDRFRDDGHFKRYGCHRNSKREPKSSCYDDSQGSSSSPRLESPARDLFPDIATGFGVDDASKNEGSKEVGCARNQKVESSSHQQLSCRNTTGLEQEDSKIFFDLLTDSNPPDPKSAQESEFSLCQAAPETEQMLEVKGNGEQSLREVSPSAKDPQAPDANSIEALLFGISVPSCGNGSNKLDSPEVNSSSAFMDLMSCPSKSIDIFPRPVQNVPTLTHGETYEAPSLEVDGNFSCKSPEVEQLITAQQHQFLPSHTADGIFRAEKYKGPTISPNNQMISTFNKTQVLSGVSLEQSAQDLPTVNEVGHVPPTEQLGATLREELPEDLFTGISPQVYGWPHGLPQGTGITLQQYSNNVMGAFPHATGIFHPFVHNNAASSNQVQVQFPSMASMQVALPPSYASMMVPTSPASSIMQSGAYMAQQEKMHMLSPRAQETCTDGIIPSTTRSMQQTGVGDFSAVPSQGCSLPGGNNPFDY